MDAAQLHPVPLWRDRVRGLGQRRHGEHVADPADGAPCGLQVVEAVAQAATGAVSPSPSSRNGSRSAGAMPPAVIRLAPPMSTTSSTNGGDSASCMPAAMAETPRTHRENTATKSSTAVRNLRWARCAPPNALTTAMPSTNSTAAFEIRPRARSNSCCSRSRAGVIISGTSANASTTGTSVISVSRQSTVNR
ncbi:hypothetical protein Acsp04_21020 [Actinomadura sp. NBRC 104425]|nr:hypothetical protein Acsp04_21020 [Actinomadura sp. NBRC 104425]